MTKKGIDVSTHQGSINWQKVKQSGVEFAIIRAGYGRYAATQKDPRFEQNYNGCKEQGIPCGAYWYSYAKTVDDAKKEAAACLEVISGKRFEYPIYFDIEDDSQKNLSKDTCTAIAKAFCSELEKAGYWVGIYSYKAFLESKIHEETLKRFAVWVAHTGVKKTTYKLPFGMWQHSHTGKVAGIVGDVDLNECYVDYPTHIKDHGLNGYKKIEFVSHTLKGGDTISSLAKKYGATVDEIAAANGFESGKVLRIPKK